MDLAISGEKMAPPPVGDLIFFVNWPYDGPIMPTFGNAKGNGREP